jgi:hypothetical protein
VAGEYFSQPTSSDTLRLPCFSLKEQVIFLLSLHPMSTEMQYLHSLIDPIMELLESGWDMYVIHSALTLSKYLLHCLFLLKIVQLLSHLPALGIDQWLAVHE